MTDQEVVDFKLDARHMAQTIRTDAEYAIRQIKMFRDGTRSVDALERIVERCKNWMPADPFEIVSEPAEQLDADLMKDA